MQAFYAEAVSISKQNVEVVVKQFEGTKARDFAGVMATWAEDVSLILHGEPFTGDTATGKTAVGDWFGDWFRQFGQDYHFDIEEAHDVGDRVFVVVTHHGRGRHSGVPVELRMAFVYTLRSGKVSQIDVWADQDREAALAAAGCASRRGHPQTSVLHFSSVVTIRASRSCAVSTSTRSSSSAIATARRRNSGRRASWLAFQT